MFVSSHSLAKGIESMRVFFICNWFPNRIHPAEGMFLKNAAEAISAYDEVTVFFAEEDPGLKGNSEEESQETNALKIKTV